MVRREGVMFKEPIDHTVLSKQGGNGQRSGTGLQVAKPPSGIVEVSDLRFHTLIFLP